MKQSGINRAKQGAVLLTVVCVMGIAHLMMGEPTQSDAKLTLSALADKTQTINGTTFTYEFHGSEKKEVDIVKIENPGETLIIPAKLKGFPVYAVGGQVDVGPSLEILPQPAKGRNDNVKTLIIEKGIKEIEHGAFSSMKKLTKLSIPKSVDGIYKRAFAGAVQLKEIKIKNPEIYIAEGAFSGCKKMRKLTFPKGTFYGEIGEGAFECCDIRELNLPYMKNLNEKQIGRYAFSDNRKLKKVTFSNRHKKITLGRDWFTDCPKAQIMIGKQVKTFSSKVNAHAGTVRLLGKQTKLTGFKKPKNRSYYYIQFKKFIVPKNSKALPILRNACYGSVNDKHYERHAGRKNYYFSHSEADMNEVKVIIK